VEFHPDFVFLRLEFTTRVPLLLARVPGVTA